jgi:dTMP kinase
MSSNRRGILVVFEGIDGTGKSTQLPLLAEHLRRKGFGVIETREPTDGPHGQRIRQLYQNRETCSREEELELFIQDRRQHVNELILPSLEKGFAVLCDRYFLSTAAYQGANGMDVDEIIERNGFAPMPDLALIFDQDIGTSIKRITSGRGEELNDFEQADALIRVKQIFNKLDLPCIRRIAAERPIEAVHADVVAAISPLLGQLRPHLN